MLDPKKKIVESYEELAIVCSALREKNGKVVVLTSGCFDILHGGHLEYLCSAAGWGDLVVGINSDEFVRRLNKGPNRPVRPQEDRAFTMAGFSAVKHVVIFDCDYKLIEAARPDIYIVSSTSHLKIQSDVRRIELLESIGAQLIELVSNKKDSTTSIIERATKCN